MEIVNLMEDRQDLDLRDLITNHCEYYQVDVIDGKFTMRSNLAEDWVSRKKCVLVIDNITKDKMLLTPFDILQDGVSDNVFKKSWQAGRYATLTFDWQVDNVAHHQTDISNWSQLLLQRFDFSWFNLLRNYLVSDEFRELNRNANIIPRQTKKIWPAKEDTYKVFSGRADTVRVVILGQDPYPNVHASGISFATTQISKPVSLRTLEKAIQKDLDYPSDWNIQNDLSNVVKQGVLLMNAAFTVEENKPGSYSDLWFPFTKKVIETIDKFPSQIIFLLLGSAAGKFEQFINKEKHTVFRLSHPASAAYNNSEWDSKGIFAAINQKLVELGSPAIKW